MQLVCNNKKRRTDDFLEWKEREDHVGCCELPVLLNCGKYAKIWMAMFSKHYWYLHAISDPTMLK